MGKSDQTSVLPFVGKNGWANIIAPGGAAALSFLQGPGLTQNPTQPLNYQSILSSALAGADQQYTQEMGNLQSNYGPIQRLQLGTVNKVANNIAATPLSQQAIASARMGALQSVNQSALGDQLGSYGTSALADSGPNALEKNFYNSASSNLALGSSLNPEEERAASQQATNAYAMRGLGTGNSAAAADLLNRYQYGQARLQQRQGAAVTADNLYTSNPLARAQSALGALGQSANAYGQAATTAYGGSNALQSNNPYLQGLGYGSNLSAQNLATQASLMNPAYATQNELGFNVPSFNANMSTSNWAAQNQMNQAKYASQMALLGQGINAGSKLATAGMA